MNLKPTFFLSPAFALCAFLAIPAKSQKLPAELPEAALDGEVQKAIREFNRIKRGGDTKPNEVTVVLDPPEAAKTPDTPKAIVVPIDPPPAPKAVPGDHSGPVLITGKPPESIVIPKPAARILARKSEPAPAESTAPPEAPGLEIRVVSLTKGDQARNPTDIKLAASFAPKPLSPAPAGWILKKAPDAPRIVKQVEIRPGYSISLDIAPHILTPEIDGAKVFAVREPGFIAADSYRQTGTVGAILKKSVAQLDEDSLKLGQAISELHNLLASLPKPGIPEPPAKASSP